MLIVELLPDPPAETWIREDWAVLEAIDCPNLSRHTSPTNRPHLTVSAHAWPPDPNAAVGERAGGSDRLAASPGRGEGPGAQGEPEADELRRRLRPATAGLPLSVPFGPPAVFGDPRSRRGLILVRTLVVTESLSSWRRTVTDLMGPPGSDPESDWVPHLTLARGLSPDQVGAALAVLPTRGRVGASGSDRVRFHEIRLWDADRRKVMEFDDPAGRGRSVPS